LNADRAESPGCESPGRKPRRLEAWVSIPARTFPALYGRRRRLTQHEQFAGRLPPGLAYRLPTEAEWEFAAHGRTGSRFGFGDDPDQALLASYAWFKDNSGGVAHDVGLKLPNPRGLFDLEGNVLEFCLDLVAPYPGGTVSNLVDRMNVASVVCRGEAFESPTVGCLTANRWFMFPEFGSKDPGFRVVLAAPVQP